MLDTRGVRYMPSAPVYDESDLWRSIIMTIASLETNFVHYLTT
jgi:hypothetical protein